MSELDGEIARNRQEAFVRGYRMAMELVVQTAEEDGEQAGVDVAIEALWEMAYSGEDPGSPVATTSTARANPKNDSVAHPQEEQGDS